MSGTGACRLCRRCGRRFKPVAGARRNLVCPRCACRCAKCGEVVAWLKADREQAAEEAEWERVS